MGNTLDLSARDRKLRSAIEDDDACRRLYGTDMAKKFKLRVAALRAAESLADFWPPKSGPERCHRLKGDRNGTFSVDLKQPHRLLFKPADEPDETLDEQQRWKLITGIELLGIEDTHG
jgi:proteic killer suppression protein